MKYIIILLTFLTALPLATANRISEDQKQFIAQYKKQKLKVAPEDALLNTDKEPCLEEGFVDLYNGKNLDGWIARGGICTFEADGESIVGTCVKGSPSTYLSTIRDDYSDFIFTAELKWEVDGNSGIMFRAGHKPGKKFETVYGPQCEMEGFEKKDRNWSGGIYGQSAGGWRYPLWLEAHADARKALKKGIWNRVTIKAVGDTVKTWINGIPAAHWVDDEFKSGFFSLQIHSGEKGKVRFRNIKVKELPTNIAYFEDLFENNSFSKWQTVSGDPIEEGWSIENGVICLHSPGKKSIITKTHYSDFELLFDWKISIGGNSGVKYRTKGHKGLEFQVLDDQRHKDGKIPNHRTGSLYDLVTPPDDKPVNPVGEWNSSRIVAKDAHIEHWLNGALVAEVIINSDDWNRRFSESKFKNRDGFGTWKGPIYLQDHSDVVWYRNVKIRRL